MTGLPLTMDVHVEVLERVLGDLLTSHHELMRLAERHRSCLRDADGPGVTEVSLERDRVNARILRLNEERVEILGALADGLGDAKAITLGTLMTSLGPERSGRLRALADELKTSIEACRREHSVLRDATAMFAGHLQGVLTRAVELCAPARTYTNRGRMASAASLPTALDVRH